MSLDTLLTEAADAGGPPTFDETDVAARVARRHTRRRAVVTAGAALLVLACAVAGLALANRGGDGRTPPVTQPIPIEPLTESALLGAWVALDGSGAELTFESSGSMEWHACAVSDATGSSSSWGGSTWQLIANRLVTGSNLASDPGGDALAAGCTADELAIFDGLVTHYGDGLLRFADETGTIDFARDGSTPDPAALRAEAVRPVIATEESVIGAWAPLDGTPGDPPSLEIQTDGSFTFSGCNDGDGDWQIGSGTVRFEVSTTTLSRCDPGLDRRAVPTNTDELVLRGEETTILVRSADEPPVEPAVDLAGSRWVTSGDDLGERATAEWIEFDESTFRIEVVCGVHEGTYTVNGTTVSLTVTERNMGPACDPIAPPADAASAIIDGDRLAVSFRATASANLPEDLETTYVDVDSLATPSADDLVGAWSIDTFIGGESYGAYQLVFDADGTIRVGSCAPTVDWTVADERLRLVTPDDDCLQDYGFSAGESSVELRLAGDRLYLDPTTNDSITVLARTADPEPRPALVLHGMRDGVGIEDWTDLPVDDEHQEAAAEVGWDSGDTITVRLGPPGTVDAPDIEVVLDGRAAFVGDRVVFDCGPDAFTVSGADRRPLLDVARVLLDTLRCDPTPPA